MSDVPETPSEIQASPAQLRGTKARDLALLLESGNLPYVELVECKTVPGGQYETVVLRIHVEVGQHPVHDIKRIENVAIRFDTHDEVCPKILALREDFPQVPHLNLQQCDYPRSLCLYDEPYDEVRLRWTPAQFLARLSEWLCDTSEGVLHRQDQPLEPLLMPDDPYTVIVHPDVFETADSAYSCPVCVRTIQADSQWPVDTVARATDPSEASHLLMIVPTPPMTHGVITRVPKNLHELHEFLAGAGLDLLGALRKLLLWSRTLPGIQQIDEFLRRTKVIFLIMLPKKRSDSGEVEIPEYRAFFCRDSNVFRIGEELGIWDTAYGGVGQLLQANQDKDGSNIALISANCTFLCQRDDLNRLSGIEGYAQTKLVCIGAGALGSQVLLNMARMGLSTWTIVDSDVLLPHNVGRHALTSVHVGKWKSTSMADLINGILEDGTAARGIPANALKPGTYEEELGQALQESDVIVDMSTSVAVSRWLGSDCPSVSRRVSLFLNPAGTDLVLLAEDTDRKVTVDCLEMQYYRHLISHPDIYANHLSIPGDGVRYGNTCRDVSGRIPQDSIAVMAGIGSRALRLAISDQQAKITIWRSKDQWLGIVADEVDIHAVVKVKSDDWTIITDKYVFGKALDLREAKLPNETGGILVGSFDAQRKLLYIMDVLPAPPDSKESPESFERGIEGLPTKRKEINEISAGWLDYIGEWHSHPRGCSCSRSQADCRQCNWIAGNMQIEGLPGLMMIVNGDGYMLYLAYPE